MNDATKKTKAQTVKSKAALTGMANALELFNEIYGEMTVLQMRVFIAVARRERATGGDLAKALDVSTPNVSRCVAVLSDFTIARRKHEPLNLVTLEHDALDRRVKYVVLTEEGATFAAALTSQFS